MSKKSLLTPADIQETLSLAREYIAKNPNALLGQLTYQGKLIWLKRRPHSKKTNLHRLQGLIARGCALPIFMPTVSSGGAESLHNEAKRLQTFAEKNQPVPALIAVTDDFILTEDVGIQLHRHLASLDCPRLRSAVLKQAMACLKHLHQAGLCHGRPSLGDITWKDDALFFIDFEENPLDNMSLAEAQARDCWLFLNSAARYDNDELLLLSELFKRYQQGISEETLEALQKMVKKLKPLRVAAQSIFKPLLGRDGKTAIRANRCLERCFTNRETCGKE